MKEKNSFDVIIVGGGPAGLSAALMLGRSRRNVLVFDNKQYRNAYSQAMHGFLTRDGIDPGELRQIAKEQLLKYENIQIKNETVTHAIKQEKDFLITVENGEQYLAKKLLLATGLIDNWPKLEGAVECYGKSIFHCPYCDGWELRDQPLAVYGRGEDSAKFALELLLWSNDIILCTDGPSQLNEEYKKRLVEDQIPIYEEPILKLVEKDGILEKIVFKKGNFIERRALFFNTKTVQRCPLAKMLGCEFDEEGGVKTGKYEVTSIPGLFVAGDSSRDVLQAIVAASEGVQAAIAINTALLNRELVKTDPNIKLSL